MTFNNTNKSDFLKLVSLTDQAKEDLINYAGTDFVTLRDSLINYTKAAYPLDYNYFVESDLGMLFIELVAYMGAVMSLKADMIANESFLLTARNRNSVRKLLQLVGVRMKGPLSSAAEAQLTTTNYTTGNVTIPVANRTISITSPEDGGQLAFTLYKVNSDGTIVTANQTGDISLLAAESTGTSPNKVWTNLALQEGTLVKETGTFAATESIKSINLNQFPVIEGSVQLYISDSKTSFNQAFTEVNNIYFASGSSDKIFQMVYDDSYKATLLFGDGILGQNPPDGASYTVTYRIGGGSRGNIVSNFINAQIVTTVGATNSFVTNTTPSTGGADAETVIHAKKYAPLTFSRQDRVVSLGDYKTFTNTFISSYGTVGKATAVTRKAYCSANVIDIYVVEKASNLQVQKATPTFKQQLITALQNKKMITDEVVVVDGLVRTLDLEVLVQVEKNLQTKESTIKSKIRDAVLTFMNVDNREFGETLVLADLNRVIYEVPEVRVSFIQNLKDNIYVDFNEIIQLNNLSIKVEYL